MLQFENVSKLYHRRGATTAALDGLDFAVAPGEFVAVMGPSGSGKSTLLHLAAALDVPSGGRVLIDHADTAAMSDAERTNLRRYRIGLVFQFFNLLPTFTVERNVALPVLLDGRSMPSLRPRVGELLDRIGLKDRADAFPDELSGGQMQRVAIARALVTRPALLLADEPTGNLDSATAAQIMALIRASAHEDRRTTLIVTHDKSVADQADRTVRIRDGRLDLAPPEQPSS